MPSTDSEPDQSTEKGAGPEPAPTYRFSFSWDGPYGHAVGLVDNHAQRGVVLDLGCGYAAVGEVLRDSGWTYLGADRDAAAVADVVSRGLEGHVVDLALVDGLAARLAALIAGRRLGAVMMLDIVEHLPDPSAVLGEVARLSRSLATDASDAPILVTSIPNVAHFDLAAKLVGGRWDVTPSGLLDRTHLQMFTEQRVVADLGRFGWHECGRDDVVLEHSDQWFPLDHPLLVEEGPAQAHLRSLRSAADPNQVVNQFVRAYRLSERPSEGQTSLATTAAGDSGMAQPFLSVLTLATGVRPTMLADSLTCLAAQSLPDLEVVVLVPADDASALESSRAVVASFEDGFESRVRVERVSGASRAVMFNAGLGLVGGRYVAFLDEGDVVTGNWADRFAEGVARAPGKLVRSVCHVRHVRERALAEEAVGSLPVTLSRPIGEFGERFDAITNLAMSTTPVPSFAVPGALLTELRFRFDENLAIFADWDFVIRAASVVGVEDTGHATSIRLRWDDTGAAVAVAPPMGRKTSICGCSRLSTRRRCYFPRPVLPSWLAWQETRDSQGHARRSTRQLDRTLDEVRGALVSTQEALRVQLERLHVEGAERRELARRVLQLENRCPTSRAGPR